MSLKSWVYRLSGIFVSILFVYLAVRRVDLSESLQVLSMLDFRWMLAGTLVYLLLGLPVRAVRWSLILRVQRLFSMRDMLVPIFVGYMANNVLPARTGDLYRAHFLARREGLSRSGVIASIVIERTLDGLMLVGLMLLLLLLFPQTQFLSGAALAVALIFIFLAAGILLHSFATDRMNRIVSKTLSALPQKVKQLIDLRLELFLKGIRGISTAKGLFVVGAYTACAWFLEACAVALVLASFQISLTLSGFALVYALSALATTIPSGPGYIGPYQYAFVLSLGASGISKETALAASFAVQFALFGSLIIVGLVLLWREQLRNRWTSTR